MISEHSVQHNLSAPTAPAARYSWLTHPAVSQLLSPQKPAILLYHRSSPAQHNMLRACDIETNTHAVKYDRAAFKDRNVRPLSVPPCSWIVKTAQRTRLLRQQSEALSQSLRALKVLLHLQRVLKKPRQARDLHASARCIKKDVQSADGLSRMIILNSLCHLG